MSTLTHRAPRQIMAGDTIEFLVQIPDDYIGWTGSARLTGPSQMNASVTTVGSDYDIKFSGQANPGTAQLTAGQYTLTVWASSGTDRKTIAQFNVTIAADQSTGAPTQPHAVKMLAIIESEIEARIKGDGSANESYTIDGTQVTKISDERLQHLRNKYAAEVNEIQNPNGQFRRVKFAFTPAGVPTDARRRFG